MTSKTAALSAVLVCMLVTLSGLQVHGAALFQDLFQVFWGKDHVRYYANGQGVSLVLDQSSGAAFKSYNYYLFGGFTVRMKLIPGNSAGTCTSFYLSSDDATKHDELDFEFLGNVSGQPYQLQTNVFVSGVGSREERINLWFDPTTDYHTYSIVWNQQQVTFFVEGTPVRIFRNSKDLGVPYPSNQPMAVMSSVFQASEWATRGGLDKIDWTNAPFVPSYQDFSIDACNVSPSGSSLAPCTNDANSWWTSAAYQNLNAQQMMQLRSVHQNYLTYTYCKDPTRYVYGQPPAECNRNM